MTVRQRKMTGVVLGRKMDKTAVVSVSRRYRHKIVGKTCTSSKKYLVHDESNSVKVGDTVEIGEVRPLSKRKNWTLLNIVSHAEGVQE